MKTKSNVLRREVALARQVWGTISQSGVESLVDMMKRFGISVSSGDIQLLDGRWYVTHSGLLRICHRQHCFGIKSVVVERHSDPAAGRWMFKSTVYKTPRSRGFVGYGDADPSNVGSRVRGAEMRVAETRAVNRALRKAYGVGLCSVEELGSFAPSSPTDQSYEPRSNGGTGNGSGPREPRLRDRLCLLIRQHNLDPALVKAYAADFCGTQTIKDASRDLVESFISHLATAAKEDRNGLVCKLNSYAQPTEAKP